MMQKPTNDSKFKWKICWLLHYYAPMNYYVVAQLSSQIVAHKKYYLYTFDSTDKVTRIQLHLYYLALL